MNITIQPIQTRREFDTLINKGHRTFFKVYDLPSIQNPWCERVDFTSVSCMHKDNIGYCASVGDLGLFNFFLGDANIEEGGYNDHFLFKTEYEARVYIAHLKHGGAKLPRAPKQKT